MAAQSLQILTQTKGEVSGMPEAENRKGQKLTGKKGKKEDIHKDRETARNGG